ncbi:MAG: hypothetical protein FWC79_00415 [Oscillospiraceae bacterium]|nr:hypothetical protein [Oscillospiraceae bacterium]
MSSKDKSKLTDKINYLGLDLNEIPDSLKCFSSLDYRPARNYDEKNYKTYKYVNIKDIKIFLTKHNRLDPITDKYAKAIPIYQYLTAEREESIERHAKFLKMITTLNEHEIEAIDKNQKELNKDIPFQVKFNKDYLWQIHYADVTDQYFMLVPTEDQDHSAFFFLLKKLLDQNTKGKLFAPICYSEYSTEFLRRSEIEELEKYIWFFTKEWPLIYDVYDKKDKLAIHVTGETFIYENAKSPYTIKLEDKESALKFYKLLKALFILATEVPRYYKIKVKINDEGGLEFYLNNEKLVYETSSEFIKTEYLRIEKQEKESVKQRAKLEKKLEKVKKETGELELEYLIKEREITTFLECKKTFFGKVKYFLGKKKRADIKLGDKKEIAQKKTNEQGLKEGDVLRNKDKEDKEFYTLEELIERYGELEKDTSYIKSLKYDIAAAEHKIKNMKLKIKNAILFLEEIDKHTKSIFEFWRFTNKDKLENLVAGESSEETTGKLKKVFDISLDFEVLGKDIDRKLRRVLNKEQLNSIYLATTEIIKDINHVTENKKITDERIEELKEEILKEKKLLGTETFDIFGNISSDSTRIEVLDNKRHRESKRDKIKLLEISKKTTAKEYEGSLKKIVENLQIAFEKVALGIGLPIYKLVQDEQDCDGLSVFNINLANLLQSTSNIPFEKDRPQTIYRINLKETSRAIGLANSVYYNNNNETLPMGMNVSDGVLINKRLLKLEMVSEEEFKVVEYTDKKNLRDVKIKTIIIKEFDVLED